MFGLLLFLCCPEQLRQFCRELSDVRKKNHRILFILCLKEKKRSTNKYQVKSPLLDFTEKF